MALAEAANHVGSTLPVLPKHVSLHIVNGQGLLFDERRQSLFSANPVATLLSCCLAESMSFSETLLLLREKTGLGAKEAARCIDEALRNWRAAGLLDTRWPAGSELSSDPRPAIPPRDCRPRQAVLPSGAAQVAIGLRLLDVSFIVEFSTPELHTAVAPLLRSLHARPDSDGAVRLAVATVPTGFVVGGRGGSCVRCARIEELAPIVLAMVCHTAVTRSAALCAIHAGAVGVGRDCVLLAGRAGAGKSTLVAGLAAVGFRPLCDDTVVMADDTLEVRPVGGAICVKEGSWPVLTDLYPELPRLPVGRRPDGRVVRYLPCSPVDCEPGEDRYAVRRIVFPHYDPTAGDASLTDLDLATSLKRLMTSMYFLDRRLDAATIERLVGWIGGIPCSEVRYASLRDGVRLLRGLL